MHSAGACQAAAVYTFLYDDVALNKNSNAYNVQCGHHINMFRVLYELTNNFIRSLNSIVFIQFNS